MASPTTAPTHVPTQPTSGTATPPSFPTTLIPGYASPPLQQTQPIPPSQLNSPYHGRTVESGAEPLRPRGRPIPSRFQGMSFSASTTSPQAVTIAYAFRNMKPEELYTKLLSAVEPKESTTAMASPLHVGQGTSNAGGGGSGDEVLHPTWAIEYLFSSLKCLGIVNTVSEAAVEDPTPRHCVRCHSTYHEKDNGLQMCKVGHDRGVLVNINERPGYVGHYFPCCGFVLETNERIEDTMGRWCVIGRHTTRKEGVVFNETNVRDCKKRGCYATGHSPTVVMAEP
ncbi:hypothetical protein EST38_g10615 [Candolleomyces aberdarensis]|uniref:Uncharacterized protein n=1 Tax=Candolleomyces aberdarensis TaxID=2316362 RepID=A0A4Q2D8I9_9AGAR|nr:hypothetical protein EST38_g10615 [Candolleomyces aberdarensis]